MLGMLLLSGCETLKDQVAGKRWQLVRYTCTGLNEDSLNLAWAGYWLDLRKDGLWQDSRNGIGQYEALDRDGRFLVLHRVGFDDQIFRVSKAEGNRMDLTWRDVADQQHEQQFQSQ